MIRKELTILSSFDHYMKKNSKFLNMTLILRMRIEFKRSTQSFI